MTWLGFALSSILLEKWQDGRKIAPLSNQPVKTQFLLLFPPSHFPFYVFTCLYLRSRKNWNVGWNSFSQPTGCTILPSTVLQFKAKMHRCAALRKNRNLGDLRCIFTTADMHVCFHRTMFQARCSNVESPYLELPLGVNPSLLPGLDLFMSNIHTHVYVIILLSMWFVFLTR